MVEESADVSHVDGVTAGSYSIEDLNILIAEVQDVVKDRQNIQHNENKLAMLDKIIDFCKGWLKEGGVDSETLHNRSIAFQDLVRVKQLIPESTAQSFTAENKAFYLYMLALTNETIRTRKQEDGYKKESKIAGMLVDSIGVLLFNLSADRENFYNRVLIKIDPDLVSEWYE